MMWHPKQPRLDVSQIPPGMGMKSSESSSRSGERRLKDWEEGLGRRGLMGRLGRLEGVEEADCAFEVVEVETEAMGLGGDSRGRKEEGRRGDPASAS